MKLKLFKTINKCEYVNIFLSLALAVFLLQLIYKVAVNIPFKMSYFSILFINL